MSRRRFTILTIYMGPDELISDLTRYTDEHGVYVIIDDKIFYTEVYEK